jgi:hypothetical protein
VNPFVFVLLLITFVGGFITLWVWLSTRAVFGPQPPQGLDSRVQQLEAEVRELRDLVSSAVIDRDEATWRPLDQPAAQQRRLPGEAAQNDTSVDAS